MSREGERKLDFLKWCKENEKLYFNRYRIEPNILRHTLTEPLKKSLSHNIENHRVQTSAIVQVGCRDCSLFDKS